MGKSKFQSWLTTDDYEIELRRKRAAKENFRVEPIENSGQGVFRDYRVVGGTDEYRIEFRSADANVNTCSCPDFVKNFLGTCKHIEKLKMQLGSVGAEPETAEIYLDRAEYRPALRLPRRTTPALRRFLERFFDGAGNVREPLAMTLPLFLREFKNVPVRLLSRIRVSEEIRGYSRKLEERDRMEKMRQTYERQLHASQGRLPFLRCALYDYQVAGMLHLAFRGRAILADEMGLGKTVQAVAAAAVMRECLGIRRVLVVAPASLKTEWEEQIRKFTELEAEAVFGGRTGRLEVYRHSRAFFLLVNYEQVMRDHAELSSLFQPDLIILDEAQRIKNWKTKTAQTLKRMESPYVFVLTGTPLENRIDDIYSLTEMVEPTIFGSLFRFNRRFLEFDADGKVSGMKNLHELHEKLRPIMLRRRKDEINENLPERIDRNYFVEMTPEQKNRYGEYETTVSRLCAAARKRPLTEKEFERLQLSMGAMRMHCDSCYIMDPKISESPKIEELKLLLAEFRENAPERKILIFSEWVRMLELVAAELDEMKLGYAMHVGSVPQKKRREEINRFKADPGCVAFLSSDSGGVGLNLQAASIVINLDLPWNPAKLEQRIARAWRKMQKHSVQVVNLVAENTIEHKMLGSLRFKQGLSDLVLDDRGDAADFERADAKSAFLVRLNELMDANLPGSKPEADPETALLQELSVEPSGIDLLQTLQSPEKPPAFLGVGDAKCAGVLKERLRRGYGEAVADARLTVIAPETRELLLKLAEQGFITLNSAAKTIFRSAGAEPPKPSDRKRRLELSEKPLETARKNLKMAQVLKTGGFAAEAAEPAWKAANGTALALYAFLPEEPPETLPEEPPVEELKQLTQLSRPQQMFLLLCRNRLNGDDPALVEEVSGIFETTESFLCAERMKP